MKGSTTSGLTTQVKKISFLMKTNIEKAPRGALFFYYYYSIRLITASVTPVNENPPSWKRFCMVTIFVRSLNKVTQ